MFGVSDDMWHAGIEQGKKQERERITKLILNDFEDLIDKKYLEDVDYGRGWAAKQIMELIKKDN